MTTIYRRDPDGPADLRIAHETGELTPGTWVDDCARCWALLEAGSPALGLVVKTGAARIRTTAGELRRVLHAVDVAGDYVREVWVELPRFKVDADGRQSREVGTPADGATLGDGGRP